MIYLITGFIMAFFAILSMQHVIDLQGFILINVLGGLGMLLMLQGIKRYRY